MLNVASRHSKRTFRHTNVSIQVQVNICFELFEAGGTNLLRGAWVAAVVALCALAHCHIGACRTLIHASRVPLSKEKAWLAAETCVCVALALLACRVTHVARLSVLKEAGRAILDTFTIKPYHTSLTLIAVPWVIPTVITQLITAYHSLLCAFEACAIVFLVELCCAINRWLGRVVDTLSFIFVVVGRTFGEALPTDHETTADGARCLLLALHAWIVTLKAVALCCELIIAADEHTCPTIQYIARIAWCTLLGAGALFASVTCTRPTLPYLQLKGSNSYNVIDYPLNRKHFSLSDCSLKRPDYDRVALPDNLVVWNRTLYCYQT